MNEIINLLFNDKCHIFVMLYDVKIKKMVPKYDLTPEASERIWNNIVKKIREDKELKEMGVIPVNISKNCPELLIISTN